MTAVDRVDCYRIDHQGFVPEIWVGLLATSFYFMQVGPIIPNVNDRIEAIMTLSLFLGSVICLFGVVLGTKWFFRKVRRNVSYIIELIGLPFIIASLGFLTYASVDAAELLVTALSGALGLTIEIGCVRLFVDIVEDFNENHEGHNHG